MKTKGFMIYLVLLSILGFLATDMYLPAFNQMASDLQTSPAMTGASLSVFLGGFACAQGIWGSLSDRTGRKPVLLVGLAIFALGCAGMIWVKNPYLMLLLRFIQAVGVCAAAVTWQSLVIDRYSGQQVNHVFATIMPLVALSPALAPLLGAWLLDHFCWRAIFVVLLLISLCLWLFTLRLKPTVPPSQPRLVYIRELLRSRTWSGNVLIYAACSASFFSWLTASPFILSDLGLTPDAIGLSYIPQTLAFLAGGLGSRPLLKHISTKSVLPGLLILYATGNIIIFGLALRPALPELTTLLIPCCLIALANGAIYPIVVSNALQAFPDKAGKAGGIQNMFQLGLCFIASMAVSAFIAHPLIATSAIMLLTIVLAGGGFIRQLHPQSK